MKSVHLFVIQYIITKLLYYIDSLFQQIDNLLIQVAHKDH